MALLMTVIMEVTKRCIANNLHSYKKDDDQTMLMMTKTMTVIITQMQFVNAIHFFLNMMSRMMTMLIKMMLIMTLIMHCKLASFFVK